jgi:hypothetical protein
MQRRSAPKRERPPPRGLERMPPHPALSTFCRHTRTSLLGHQSYGTCLPFRQESRVSFRGRHPVRTILGRAPLSPRGLLRRDITHNPYLPLIRSRSMCRMQQRTTKARTYRQPVRVWSLRRLQRYAKKSRTSRKLTMGPIRTGCCYRLTALQYRLHPVHLSAFH